MAEDKFNSNSRSPRFSTTKALGFKGGSTNPQTGNLQQPTFLQSAGINTAPPPQSAKDAERDINPAISQFSAPKQPGLVSTLATGVGTAVAGEAVKQGVNKGGQAIGSAISNYMTPKGYLPGGGYSSETMRQSFPTPETANMSMDPALVGERNAVMELGGRPAVPSFLQPNEATAAGGVDGANFFEGSDLGFAGDAASYGTDIGSSFADTADLADAAMGEGFGAAGDAAFSGTPIVGPLMRAAQGDYGGAAGSAIGGTIGSAILPGIGTAVGSFLGGMVGGDCFITEAVMSSGGADNGMELEALRGFRDNILMATPQGQAMVAEYEAIAPVVVEAVSARPDGMQIFQQIKAQFIDAAVLAVQQGNYQEALQTYANMIGFVTPFAAEAAEAGIGGQDPDAMNQMGDHAAMIGNSPELAGAAMPGGQEWDPGTDDDSMMGAGGMMPTGAPMMPQQGGGMQMPQMAGPPQPPIAQTFSRRY